MHVDDLRATVTSERVRELVKFECARAAAFIRRPWTRVREDRKRLVAAEIMRAVYFETLKRIERSRYDALTARLRVPRPRQASLRSGSGYGPIKVDAVVIAPGSQA